MRGLLLRNIAFVNNLAESSSHNVEQYKVRF